MTDVADGETIEVRLPGGVAVAAEVGPAVMGPPGLRGPVGPRGDPGGTTTVVFSFGLERTPQDLPANGLIPSGWDGVRHPEAPIQVGVGQSLEYLPDGYLWLYVSPAALPGGWYETGQLRGPPGDTGPMGDRGPSGPPGERGLQGNTGAPGPTGTPGPTGPQGARGEQGNPGTPGPIGIQGPKGDKGDTGTIGPEGPIGITGPEGPQGQQGIEGPIGLTGEQGEQGEPGSPSFIVGTFFSQTVAALPPNGLIPANWDGPGRPNVAYQMKVGEALVAQNTAEPGSLHQAFVFIGSTLSPSSWTPIWIRGDTGDTGAQGPQGIQGPQGADGVRGSVWWWSPIDPPMLGNQPDQPGDMILVMMPGNPDLPAHGNIYISRVGGTYELQGNIRGPRGLQGPAGPQGEPGLDGEVRWADVIPIVNRIDALEARMARMEAISAVQLPTDMVLRDGMDEYLSTVLTVQTGDHIGFGTLTVALERNEGDPAPPPSRTITAWLEATGPVVVTGNMSGQIFLHQAINNGSLTIGPCRILATGAASVAVRVRSDPDVMPTTGKAVVKASTSVAVHSNATGFVAR